MWRRVSTHRVIIKPIIGSHLRYTKWKYTFWDPRMCTFTWCTSNMIQWLAWWWLYETKHVATFIIDNKLTELILE